ncbi:serine/threonine protein kinase FSK [Pseudohyphozyma bogoriensis]|nr:serine/threonine protein kinase FSK [Pseudohyphozyma bogoriensis]
MSTPSSTAPPSGTVTPSESGADPLPTFSSLDLSLSRDQGVHHVAHGAGSEATELSKVASHHHDRVAHRILSNSSASGLSALSPENLPQAPKELPISPIGTNGTATPSGEGVVSSTVATPGESRIGTPTIPASQPMSTAASSNKSASTNGATTPIVPPTPPTAHSAAVPSAAASSAPMSTKNSTADKEKKSVFGKLFGNGSSTSLASGEKMERGDSSKDKEGGAVLARKPSKKETEKAEKERLKAEREAEKKAEREEKLLRVPSGKRDGSTDGRKRSESQAPADGRPRAASQSSHGAKEKKEEGGMGQALNDFMRNKVQRKTSVTSKKSDDGKSDNGSQYGGSQKSAGAASASLLKKYGVCEKVAIGKGATATVKLAHKWDRTTERLYAVKEFRKRRKNETEKEYVKKLTSEFCISSTLHHQNIVETVDLVQDEQNHWCEVMEYCPGGDLYAAIKKGSMTALEINSYFKQILSGVTYLHSMGVAHRDIKPENLLLDAKGHVKITDFGVSDVFRMCWEKTTHLSKGLCGSEPYIAPEQFEQKEYDARLVDVWACAVVFYCMHFQELPWRVAKPSDPSFGPYMQLYHGNSSPAPVSNIVPRECRAVIKRMLDPNPKTRATTEQIAADPWFSAIVVTPPLEDLPPLSVV